MPGHSQTSLRARPTARALLALLASVGLVLGVFAQGSPAQAAPGADSGIRPATLVGFNPGNLMSDEVFTDKNTMTEAEIQAFFEARVRNCQVLPPDQYGPIVCLKDFKITSVDRPADNYCSGYKGAANESAARIIYKVAQACDINPQVLIVMLQKEQGLITHTWPSQWRYDKALGQGCPDTAPCDPKFVGFFHQIYGAARQMQIYMEGRYFTWYAAGKTWNIRYHPNASCGSSPVFIENRATEALYYYTPYQPNAAALRAGYGTGDSCSAYGNRNFYNYFTDWFGSAHVKAPENPPGSVDGPPPGSADGPRLGSIDRDTLTVAVDASGAAWAYPLANGKLGTPTQIATGLSGYRQILPIGDFRGTGHRDFVAIDGTGDAWLLRGNGTTTLDAPVLLTRDWRDAKLITAAGDFDGDGIPDVFTANAAGDLLLWRGTGNGAFRSPTTAGVKWHVMDKLIGGYDMTGDGNTDLVARHGDGRLLVYRGNGRGGWSGSIQAGHGWGVMKEIVVPGDLTGDGIVDVLAVDSTGALRSYAGVGDGRVRSAPTVGTGWGNIAFASGAGPIATGPRAALPGVGDLDGDGARDVLGLSDSGELRLYRGNGVGRWAGTVVLESGWNSTDAIHLAGNFSGNGQNDLFRKTSDGVLYLHASDGDGGFSSGVRIGQGWNAVDIMASGFDFDGDGVADVLARTSNGDLTLYSGNGRGGWLPARPKVGSSWGQINLAFYAGDFDGSGGASVMARRLDGTLWLYPFTGDGRWGTPRQIGHAWDVMSAVFSPGDFNGDGNIDVLARNQRGDLVLYRGNGRGGWLGAVTVGAKWDQLTQIR